MKRAIWISFDLGVRGDYEGLYAWLDEHQAEECGESLAFLQYEHKGDFLTAIKKDLKRAMELTKNSRVYVIHLLEGRMKGTFVFGRRKAPPWTGFARGQELVVDES
jgi:hypothetical protein